MATFARYFPREGEDWEAWEDEDEDADAVPPEVKNGGFFFIFAVII